MGNDGGSIPKRRELVKNAARAPTISELKSTALESLGHAWSHCALSGDQIDLASVASDWRGRLFNYESILKGLMPSDEPSPAEVTPATLGIRSLRDVAKLKFSKTGDKWTCPISMKEMGPATKAVYLVPCGHTFADVAIKEIPDNMCPSCAEVFSHEHVIPILPIAPIEVSRLEQRIEKLRATGHTHTLKKDKSDKKKKKRKADEVDAESTVEKSREQIGRKEGSNGIPERKKTTIESRISGINNPMAASLTAKVLAEQEERNKRRKLAAGLLTGKSEAARG
ncbi:unnamed protein product [Clonostachys rhizophaga]|uniref:Replication termination factor 2 n=1 Tax=Clonostachys rhizophaga TaxID=160324 RepID=A0A9N9W3A7_9HYPO|nr:unnamed protein product [Clonostachys rhizophaga]